MYRLLLVTSALGGGGAERVLSILADYFDQEGYQVEVVSLVSDRHEYLDSERIKNLFIGDSKSIIVKTVERYTKLRKIIHRYKPDVIVSFGAEINMYTLLARGRQHCPIIVSERNDPYVSPKNAFIRSLRNRLYQKSRSYCISDLRR